MKQSENSVLNSVILIHAFNNSTGYRIVHFRLTSRLKDTAQAEIFFLLTLSANFYLLRREIKTFQKTL